MAIKRPMHGIRQAQKWPMCGNYSGPQQAHMWQSTGTEMAIKRRTHGSEQAQKWPICGSCSGIQKAQMWQSTGTYMAINRHIHGSQQAHTYQSTVIYRAYMAVNMHIRSSHTHIAHMWQLFVHTKGRGGNKNEHKLVAQKTRRDKDNYFNILLIRQC